MNILPLIIGFIAIFSCLSFTFLKEAQILSIAEWSFNSSAAIENELQKTLARRHYMQTARVRNRPSTVSSQSDQKKPRRYFSRRAINPPIEYAKLNLSPMLDEDTVDVRQHPIYQIAAELIRTLYEKTSLIAKDAEKGWENALLDAMIQKGKKIKERSHLSELFPDDPKLHAIYYKMLKGTNQYDLEKNKGIAQLADFLSVEPEKKENTIYFCFASVPLLKALFNPKIADAILTEEKNKWEETGKYHFSSKQELQDMLLKDATLANALAPLEPYLNFQQQIPRKKQIAGQDQQTGLVIKREIL